LSSENLSIKEKISGAQSEVFERLRLKDDLNDPCASDYFFSLVEDGGVAGGDGALGLVEGD
jgi:hypothetical protein